MNGRLRALTCSLAALLLAGVFSIAGAASPPTLFRVTAAQATVLAQGAQKSWPVKISEDSAFNAVFQGGMWLPNPAGGRIYARYSRHIMHANGTWTWVGKVSTIHGEQSVVLTFGNGAVFGLIPQASGYPLRVVTRHGETRIVETSASAMARSPVRLRLQSRSDAVVPPRVSRHGGPGLGSVSVISAAAPASTAAAAAPAVADTVNGTVTIDVMVVYTPGFVSELGSGPAAETRIQNLVDLTNQAYLDSGVNQQIRLVHSAEVNYPDDNSNNTALDDITGTDGNGNLVPIPASLQGVASMRVQYGADLVTLIRGYDNATQENCGVGWLNGAGQTPINPATSKEFGYSVVSDGSNGGYYCLDTTFAHELGHNMGDDHDRAHSQTGGGAYPYSYGYLGNGTDGFSTIMAYGSATDTPVAFFSNPDVAACQNSACGVSDSSSNSADNAHSMNNTAPLIAQFEPTMVGAPLAQPSDYVRNDITGDGKSALLWMNTGANSFGYWIMDGANVVRLWSISVTSGYRVVATGDFNGDGRVDILWEGAAGDLYLWLNNGTSFTSEPVGSAPAGMSVVGAGDLNGDGTSDLIFSSPGSGMVTWWLMNGATRIGEGSQQGGAGYSIAAIGDFDGDGRADLIWTNAARNLYLWDDFNDGFSSHFVAQYPAGWQLVGAGDVNGDGDSDLIWRNQSAGLFGYWLMHGATVASLQSMTAVSNYHVAAVGDFNGDGKVDVVWTSKADDLYFWFSTGTSFSAQYAGTYPAGWSVIPSQLMAAGKP